VRLLECGTSSVSPRHPLFRQFLAVTLLLPGGATFGSSRGAAGRSGPPSAATDPTIAACLHVDRAVCNSDPGARATIVAGVPAEQPVNPQARLINRVDVILRAGGASDGHDAVARLMRYSQVGLVDTGLGENALVDPSRWVWVVTVHEPVRAQGTLQAGSGTWAGYTEVIDAESGDVTDSCAGCVSLH